MKGLNRRIEALEAKTSSNRRSLDHLTDEELDQHAFDLIRQFADAGMTLPDDWRERYDRNCIRFLEWVKHQVKEMIACEA